MKNEIFEPRVFECSYCGQRSPKISFAPLGWTSGHLGIERGFRRICGLKCYEKFLEEVARIRAGQRAKMEMAEQALKLQENEIANGGLV